MKKIIYMLSFVMVFTGISYAVALAGITYGEAGAGEQKCPTIEVFIDKNTPVSDNADGRKVFEPFIDDGFIEYGDITNPADLPQCEPIEIFLN